jgi:hypothetical protein
MKPSDSVGRGEPFTIEQNDEVYKRLVAGDIKARDEMMVGNVALAIYRVEAYLRGASQMSYYRDEMISAGILGLCSAVERMQKRGIVKNPKPTGCITKAIDRYISHCADEANTIVVSSRVQQMARAVGEPIILPHTVSEKTLISVDDTSIRDREEVSELKEEALACCKDEVEKTIVTMRVDGYTDAQIGKSLNLVRRRVSRLRQDIFKRFNERCPEYKETERAKIKRLTKETYEKAKRATKKSVKETAK